MSFLFGLTLGLAVAFIVGFFILLKVAMGGELKLAFKDTSPAVNQPTAQNPNAGEPSPSAPVEIKLNSTDHVLGSSKAKVTIVEFSDFQCPFCGQFHPTLKRVLSEYKDRIRLVYRHFPLDSIHQEARPAANASECAAEQGKFWEYHDKLFENQAKLSASYYPQLATELKLNTGKFNDCLSKKKYESKIDADYQSGIDAGVRGTPHSLVNGAAVSGAVPYEQLKSIIDQQLAK